MRFSQKTTSSRLFFLFLPLAAFLATFVILVTIKRNFVTPAFAGCTLDNLEAQTGEFAPESLAYFENQPLAAPSQSLALAEAEKVLAAVSEDRWIEVDISEQKLYAHEGDRIVYQFSISSGKWAPTPTGEFRIWVKLRQAKMSGGSRERGDYYYLPNVPYIMYFYQGYGLHGTYWHNNFGTPMSHGCVNLAIPDAEKLYHWTGPAMPAGRGAVYPSENNPGTRVVVHE